MWTINLILDCCNKKEGANIGAEKNVEKLIYGFPAPKKLYNSVS